MQFHDLKLDPRILAAVSDLGWTEPTPIQRSALPAALEGRDLLGLARTGSGKTAAFLLPIIQRIAAGPRRRVRALVVAPTRELAEQIHQAATALGRPLGVRSVAIYGGVGANPQVAALRAGREIVVACPGRLLDHVAQRTIDLGGVEVLVLDEADRMFDMGFLPDVRRIVRAVPPRRQTLLFSATMPAELRHLADELLREPARVQVDHGRPAETVAHALYPVPGHLKSALLLELLRGTDTESVIVFTRTKHRAKKVGQLLERAGHRATSLQGNLSQNRRQAALEGFRSGAYTVLVATDIAARGIDVTQISHVVNYDIPDTVDAYTHRIGRTGRLARTGDAFTFVAPEDGAMVRAIERVLGEPIERRTLPGFDYRAPAPERAAEPRPAHRGARPAEQRRPARAPARQPGPGGERQGRAGSGGRGRRPASEAPRGREGRLTANSRCDLISPTAR